MILYCLNTCMASAVVSTAIINRIEMTWNIHVQHPTLTHIYNYEQTPNCI